jgi:hypothetical protein
MFYMIFYQTPRMVIRPVLEGTTRIIMPPRGGKTGILYIPADIVKDSSFPFEANERVLVRIEGRKLIVESENRI